MAQFSSVVEIREIIARRLKEFERLGKTGVADFDFAPFINLKFKSTLQSEFAFCISTANSSAISGLKFQKTIEHANLNELSISDFEELLRSSGVRFHRKKAVFIEEGINNFDNILNYLDSSEARDKLVRNLRGFGLKEASHFLRNIGRKDIAIIDRHIIRYLAKENHITEPSRVSSKVYIDCESALREVAAKRGMSPAELDLWLWYGETGKVLK
jgi:N-glycosylase/DNA lyase